MNIIRACQAADDDRFRIVDSLSYNQDNSRLMPLHPTAPFAYLLTERSNRIIVYQHRASTLKEIQDIRIPMAEAGKDFCGGIAIDETGTYLCVSVRGQDVIILYQIQSDGTLLLLDSRTCGKMPRDLLIRNGYVFVTCTNGNRIEVFGIADGKLTALDSTLAVHSPITFAAG